MKLNQLLTTLTAVLSLALAVWATFQIAQRGLSTWSLSILLYIALVSITLFHQHRCTAKNISTISPPFASATDKQDYPIKPMGEQLSASEKIILEVIRTTERAQRHDFLLQVGLSRSSLGRLLDQMEAQGLIRQQGERKASYYVLAEKSVTNL